MCREPPTVLAIAEDIALYLRAHPEAADSVEGIRQWWIAGRGAPSAAQVESALERLLGEGVVMRQVMPDGAVLYRGARTEERHER